MKPALYGDPAVAEVPSSPPAAPGVDTELRRTLLDGLGHELKLPMVPLGLRVSAWFSAVALIVLLLCYGLLMLATVWFALDYLLGHVRLILDGAPVSSTIVYLFLGLLTLIVAVLLVKPALYWSPDKDVRSEVTRADQPLLWEYVERLCTVLNTPVPARISVVTYPTAAAYLGGFWHTKKNKLELRLGLPFVAGMTVRELTAILAHELGHFTRLGASRLLGFVGLANFWFVRGAYERDRFDLWLVRMCARLPLLLSWPLWSIRAVLWTGRLILRIFWTIGCFGVSGLSRQKEYQCDQYSATVAGSAVAIQALHRVTFLSIAHEAVLEDIGRSWLEKRLPDDLAMFVVAKADRLPQDKQKELLRLCRRVRTGWLDTHPALLDRTLALQALNCRGVIDCDRPARQLLCGFFTLSQRCTLEFYRGVLKEHFPQARIVPTEALACEQKLQEDAGAALDRYFQGLANPFRPIFPADSAARPPKEADRQELETVIGLCAQADDRLNRSLGEYLQVRRESIDIQVIRALRIAGVQVQMPGQHLPANAMREQKRIESCAQRRQAIVEKLEVLEKPLRRRLTLALRLLKSDQVRQAGPGKVISDEQLAKVLAMARALESVLPDLEKLATNTQILLTLLQVAERRTLTGSIHQTANRFTEMVRQQLIELRTLLCDTAYPYEHADEQATLGDYFLETSPERSAGSAEIVVAAGEALDRMSALSYRVQSHLALAAETAECAMGFARQKQTEPPQVSAVPADPKGPRARTPAAVQAVSSVLVVALMAAVGAGFSAATPRFAVLPKHQGYRPTIIPATWTPPPEATVWNRGFSPYQHTPYPHIPMPGSALPNQGPYAGATRTDPWGRPVDPRRPHMGYQPPNPYGGSGSSYSPNIPGTPGYNPAQPYRPYQPSPTHGYSPNRPGYPGQGGYNPNQRTNPYRPGGGYNPPPSHRPGGGYRPGGGGASPGGGGFGPRR